MKRRIWFLAFVLLVAPAASAQQRTPGERIASLESDMRNVRETLHRIEDKIDDAAAASAKGGLLLGDRTLELLLILIVGGDKVLYWRKRRNGTWTKSAPIRATVSDNSHEENAIE